MIIKKERLFSYIQKFTDEIVHEKKIVNSSLADMYGDKSHLFSDLQKAHKANDKAVMQAYGFKSDMSESEIVAELMKMYQKLTGGAAK